MAVKCPKCDFDNTSGSKYCKECGTQLPSQKDISVSQTKTLETPKEELTTGATFAGRYQIIEELGKGGMGKVYRVIDKKLNEEVALKLIKPEIASDKKTVERFSNELKLARKIVHKNVGRMYHLSEEKGTHYITMEYVPGEDLKGMIRMMGQLGAEKSISIAKQVCEGLSEAHRLGVIHRDLKPSNIMIDKEGNARIMDFGIARSLKAKGITGTGVVIGTPEYMSPEQVEGKEIDQRTDIYSLGIILYEMATGRIPFEGETAFSIALKHKSEMPRDPRELNAQIGVDLSILILQCLEKDRDKRYQSVEDLISDFTKIEERISTTERVVPKRQPLTARGITVKFSLKKFIVPTVVVLALVILITVSVFLIKKLPSGKPLLLPPSHKQLSFTGNASSPAISPDGKFLAYVNRVTFNEQVVMVQDIVSGNAIEVFRADFCRYLRWTPDSSEISFHAKLDDGTLSTFVVPRLGGTPRQLPAYPYLAWSPDGSQYAGAAQSLKQIRLINKTTGDSNSISLNFSTYLFDIDWSPKGGLLLYCTHNPEEEKYAICTITTDGSKEHKVVEDTVPLISPRWSPRGDAIFYLRRAGPTNELWKILISSDTGEAIKSASVVLQELEAGNYFTITNDGKHLSYARKLNYSNLWLATVEGSEKEQTGKTKQLTTGTLMNFSPNISPDGSQIAFSRGDGKKNNIYVMPIEGGSPTQITFMNSYNFTPVWSPDGKEIAFCSDEGGTRKVWKVNAKGGIPYQFALSKTSGDLIWSPGANILYQIPGNRNYHILNPSTEEEIPLVEDDLVGWMFNPRYSPDGRKVALDLNRIDKDRGIYVISLSDSSQVLIKQGMNWLIGWSSDGKWIYIYEAKGGTIRIFMVEVESGREKTVVTIPFTFELGVPGLPCISTDGKNFVIPVDKTNSDVWLVENFDIDMK